MNNRTLLIVFISCLVLFFAGKFLRGNTSSSFDPEIMAVDTAKVDRIQFISGGEQAEEFSLVRNGQAWEAVKGDLKVTATAETMSSILEHMVHLNAKRIVTKDPSRYAEYEIEGEKAGQMKVWEGKKQVADLQIGGFRFDQAARTATSFIRKADKPEVFVVDGFMSMAFKARFDHFRDRKLVQAGMDDLTSVEWTNHEGRKEVIQKEDGLWHYAGMEAVDSAKFALYLTSLVAAQGHEFSELTSTQGLSLLEKLTLTGNNMIEPTVISAYASPDTTKPFLIHSSINPQSVFKSEATGLYKQIFSDLRPFWPHGQ